MPNIRQIISLREKYNQKFQSLNESFDMSSAKNYIDFSVTKDKQTPDIIKYFEEKKKETVVLLFIDITDFSIETENLTVEDISNRLNDYYDKLIPIVYEHNGEIEKIMGDGIICIFGEPFFQGKDHNEKYYKAESCAREIINKFCGTINEVKIALHSGQVMYYKTPTNHYKENTMIGKPLTELYRLESISESNSINYFEGSVYDRLTENLPLGLNIKEDEPWKCYYQSITLKGVDYKTLRYLKRVRKK